MQSIVSLTCQCDRREDEWSDRQRIMTGPIDITGPMYYELPS